MIDSNIIADDLVKQDSIIIPNSYEKELVYDFNGDDQMDSLFLGANVEVDDEGNAIWDDAQNWFINLKIKDSLYKIYSKSIQLGKVIVYFDEVKNEIYLKENGPYQTEIYKLDGKNNFKPVEIKKFPDTKNMVLLSLD